MTDTHDPLGLDELDPTTTPDRDATHFRRIVAAREAAEAAEAEVRAAVVAAREAGDSWTIIGFGLGITRQAAQQRYGTRARAKSAGGRITHGKKGGPGDPQVTTTRRGMRKINA